MTFLSSSVKSRRKQQFPPYRTVQTLGEHTYAIPALISNASSSKIRSLFLILIKVIAVPFIVVIIAVLLILPPFIRNAFVARFIPFTCHRLSKTFHNQRQLLLQHVQGKVMDVGSGGGAYFYWYGKYKVSHVVALEPMIGMHKYIKEAASKAGLQTNIQLTLSTERLEDYVQNRPSEHGTFDWVVLGNVLCEVHDVSHALQNVHLLLKPGGHVYFCEHIASPRHTWLRHMQNTVNPIWCRISGGCNCNHESLNGILSMPEWDVVYWPMDKYRVAGVPMVMGLARKVSANI